MKKKKEMKLKEKEMDFKKVMMKSKIDKEDEISTYEYI
jgi:hypothetical protein